MKAMPRIDKVMTTMPHTVGKSLSVRIAHDLMKENQIRHLPVLDDGNLVGVITDRDIKLAASFDKPEHLKVEDVMTADPFSVAIGTPLDHVTNAMAEHRYGCAVIRQENGKVVGIFTLVDALRVLGDTLQAHHKN